jgi:putative spermidine/putrescine transport system permease protein
MSILVDRVATSSSELNLFGRSVRRMLQPAALLLPGLLLLSLAFLLPLGALALGSFVGEDGTTLTLARYAEFFADTYNLGVIQNTLEISLSVALVTLLFGYPIAYWLARSPSHIKVIGVMLATFPLIVSGVVRIFGWETLFMPGGVLLNWLAAVGLGGIRFQDTQLGVVIAEAGLLMPYMIITLLGVIEGIDTDLELAAQDLGASTFETFRLVTLPLSLAGVLGGSLLVFVLSASSFATPNLIGGTRVHVVATEIYGAISIPDFQYASSMAVILLVGTLLLTYVYSRLLEKKS